MTSRQVMNWNTAILTVISILFAAVVFGGGRWIDKVEGRVDKLEDRSEVSTNERTQLMERWTAIVDRLERIETDIQTLLKR